MPKKMSPNHIALIGSVSLVSIRSLCDGCGALRARTILHLSALSLWFLSDLYWCLNFAAAYCGSILSDYKTDVVHTG
jgi:hypothetical protein